MSAPVISTTQSVLSMQVGRTFTFQPFATNSPLRWTASGLPPGMSIDTPEAKAATGATATDIVTSTAHGYVDGDKVYFETLTGGSGVAINTVYHLRDKTTDTFKLSLTAGGAVKALGSDISASLIRKVSTGAISGAPTSHGVYVAGLQAINGDGTGEQEFAIGVDRNDGASGGGLSQSSVPVTIDLITKEVTVGEIYVAEGDDLLLDIFWKKDGADAVLDISELGVVVKEFEPDGVLCESEYEREVSDGEYWQAIIPMTGDALAGALSNYEADAGTEFLALVEIEWTEAIAGWGGGPTSMKQSCKPFKIWIGRDLKDG